MKKTTLILFALLAALLLSSCGKGDSPVVQNNIVAAKPADDQQNSETVNTIDNDGNQSVDVNKLSLLLPSGWKKVARGQFELGFNDEKDTPRGGIIVLGHYSENEIDIPNHSSIVSTEDIITSIGNGKLVKLQRDNPAASKDSRTWIEYHALIPIKGIERQYDIWIEEKSPNDNSKEILLNLLKHL